MRKLEARDQPAMKNGLQFLNQEWKQVNLILCIRIMLIKNNPIAYR